MIKQNKISFVQVKCLFAQNHIATFRGEAMWDLPFSNFLSIERLIITDVLPHYLFIYPQTSIPLSQDFKQTRTFKASLIILQISVCSLATIITLTYQLSLQVKPVTINNCHIQGDRRIEIFHFVAKSVHRTLYSQLVGSLQITKG